jgi:hypothetical protein
MPYSEMFRLVSIVRTNVSCGSVEYIFRVERILERGTALTVKDVTLGKTAFFIVTVLETSNLT